MQNLLRQLLLPTLLLLLPTGVLAQHGKNDRKGGGMEQFEEVDPYTQGDRELMKLFGYANFGNILWSSGELADQVAENMGGMPVLWAETEHFKIGTSLTSYSYGGGDREEANWLKEEVAAFAKLFPRKAKIKPPKKKLDPWLRLHLHALRLEKLYADLIEDFGLQPQDYSGSGPYLGQNKKFLVLLCQRKSEMGRYLRTYMNASSDHSFRWYIHGEAMFFTINVESLTEGWSGMDVPVECLLNSQIIQSVLANMLDGYRQNNHNAPLWLKYGLGHRYAREYDPRWVFGGMSEHGVSPDDGLWKWEPRVRKLVKNEFFASTEEMFAWQKYEEMNSRDHMIAWSRVCFLLSLEGDHRTFLNTACSPVDPSKPDPGAIMAERQKQALQTCYGMTPAELDEAWMKWVNKTYAKK